MLRPWALLSALLNAGWLFTVQLELLWLSVVVILLLLAVLIRIMYILGRPRTGGIVEMILTDGTFGPCTSVGCWRLPSPTPGPPSPTPG